MTSAVLKGTTTATCLECDISLGLRRGLCNKHYARYWAAGTLDEHALPPIPRKLRREGASNFEVRPHEWLEMRETLWDTTIKLSTAHYRVKRLWGKAAEYPCIECGQPAQEWAYDGTDPTQVYGQGRHSRNTWMFYSRFPEFYMPMCLSCHRSRDQSRAGIDLHAYRMSQITPPPRRRRRPSTRPPNRR